MKFKSYHDLIVMSSYLLSKFFLLEAISSNLMPKSNHL